MMRLSVLVGAIAIFLCGSAEQSAMQLTVVNRQMMDEAVIETVLVDVLTSSDNEAKTIRFGQGEGQLIFNNECTDRVFISPQAIDMTKEKWESAKLADAAAVREAVENALDRIKRKDLYAPFKPQDKRISIWKENPASTQPRESIGSISAVFQNPFLAESFPASHSTSDKVHLCNPARKSASIFERYFTEKIEFCTLFLNQSTRGCCKISSEAEIRRNQSVWRRFPHLLYNFIICFDNFRVSNAK
jgi:hypothetical protein